MRIDIQYAFPIGKIQHFIYSMFGQKKQVFTKKTTNLYAAATLSYKIYSKKGLVMVVNLGYNVDS